MKLTRRAFIVGGAAMAVVPMQFKSKPCPPRNPNCQPVPTTTIATTSSTSTSTTTTSIPDSTTSTTTSTSSPLPTKIARVTESGKPRMTQRGVVRVLE